MKIKLTQHGTLIKSDQAALQEFLVFRPVDNKALVTGNNSGIPSNLKNSALDIETASGITLPDEATHVLIEYFLDINFKIPPDNTAYNSTVLLYIGDNGEDLNQVTYCDGSFHKNLRGYWDTIDLWGADEQQSQGSALVRLSDHKTIAYEITRYYENNPLGGEAIDDLLFYLRLQGYYVPLSALLKQ